MYLNGNTKYMYMYTLLASQYKVDMYLTLCMLGKNINRQHFELFFTENRILHSMKIVS